MAFCTFFVGESGGDNPAPPAETEPLAEKPVEKPPPPEVVVEADHPEVVAIVEAALVEAEKEPVNLSPEVQVEVLVEAVRAAEKELRHDKTEGPM